MRSAALLVLLALAGCNGDVLSLRYHLDDLDRGQVVAVQTTLVPVSPERFMQPVDEIAIDADTSYRVSCSDCAGDCPGCSLVMIVEHRAPTGGELPETFTLQFRAGSPAPSRLLIGATAPAADGSELGRSLPTESAFLDTTIDLFIRPKSACGAITCSPTQACCGDACIDVSADPKNCGDCGIACGSGEACTDGVCTCADGASCGAGTTCCPAPPVGTCVDTTTDPLACGGCGIVCAEGEHCAGGGSGGPVACGCGASGAPCAETDRCCGDTGECVLKGTGCQCGTAVCAPDQTCCGGACTSLDSDSQNCGACGHPCKSGTTCEQGVCSCGGQPCADSCCNDSCVQLLVDPTGLHCGSCDTTCQPGERCSSGTCICNAPGQTCTNEQICCGIGCVDHLTDNAHCGDCTTVCAAGQQCTNGVCQDTSCSPACGNGNKCVDGTCECGGAMACAGAQQCCLQFVGPAQCTTLGTTLHCTGCDDACRPGELCGNATEGCTCNGGMRCSGNDSCCSNGCKDLTTFKNCGACGVICGIGEKCTNNGKCACGSLDGGVGTGPVCDPMTKFCDGGACVAMSAKTCPAGPNFGEVDCTSGGTAMNEMCCAFCGGNHTAFSCGMGICPADCKAVFR